MKGKRFTSPDKRFHFIYPEDWETLVVEDIPAFFHPEMGGVLQIYSFANKVGNVDSMTELKNYISVHEIEFNEELVATFTNSEGTNILSCEFKKEDRHWCVYAISNQNKLLIATFNSDIDIDDKTYKILASIISSVQFLK